MGEGAGTSERRAGRQISSATSLVAGSVSGVATAALTQPLDVLRTEMQRPCRGKTKPHLSTHMALQHVLETRGWTGLWCGLVPTVLRVGVGMGVYFYCLNQLGAGPSGTSSKSGKQRNSSLLFSSGVACRAVAAIVVQPLTVIKTRFEAGDRGYGKTVVQNIAGIVRQEGVRGLMRGAYPTILRDAPYSGIYLLMYTHISRLLSPDGPLHRVSDRLPRPAVTFATGIIAGALGSIVTNPVDLVRTRMQLRDGPHGARAGGGGLLKVTWEIGKTEGVMLFVTRGIVPRILKRSLQSALTWTMYTEFIEALIKHRSRPATDAPTAHNAAPASSHR